MAMKAERRVDIPPGSVPAIAFDPRGTARRIESVGLIFDLDEPVRDRLAERQHKILSRIQERDTTLSECLRPIARESLHGTVYLAGIGIPQDRKDALIRSTLRRAREVARSIPEISATLGVENRLGPWLVTNMYPNTEEDLGRWKELQASMGHLEFHPIYYIHTSLLVLTRPVEENDKVILDEVLETVRRESASEPPFPVKIKQLQVMYASDFDHFSPAGEPLLLLSAEEYRRARRTGYELIARYAGLKDPGELEGPEYRDRLWALRGWFPGYFWPHVDAMLASVGSGAIDPRRPAELMQARKLQSEILGDAAMPVVQVRGLDARPRVGTLHTIMRAVEACGLPLAILHQAGSTAGDLGLDLQLIFERRDEACMARVVQSAALIPDLPPGQAAAEESEALSLVIKLPRGLGRLGDILQALDNYDPRIAVQRLLGHPHWEDYDWLDLDLVIPEGRKDEVKKLVRFWASYRYTDEPVWVAEQAELRGGSERHPSAL